jgi:small conductance mechanosensitive channel
MGAQGRGLEAIKHTLTAHGIDLPYPTQQILLHDQNEATDGNRHTQREGWPAGKGAVPDLNAAPEAEPTDS